MVQRDLARGYISADVAKAVYGLSEGQISTVLDAVRTGESE
jgi:hypothetical protein